MAALRAADPEGARFARTLRRTYDQIYDGGNTGRLRWEQLKKTEKTYFGSLVEINLQREFSFGDGIHLDYRIAGADVDCKWSQTDGGWMLRPEAIDQICLLMTGSDQLSVWSAGLIRAVEPLLNTSSDRDDKKTLNATDRPTIHWIWKDKVLPENVLLHVDPAVLQAVMVDLAGPRHGQKRLDELFRRVPNRIIGCGAVATVAQQDDYIKRMRAIRGSRQNLKREGIVVFGDYHKRLALRLGLPQMGDGDSMSAPARPDRWTTRWRCKASWSLVSALRRGRRGDQARTRLDDQNHSLVQVAGYKPATHRIAQCSFNEHFSRRFLLQDAEWQRVPRSGNRVISSANEYDKPAIGSIRHLPKINSRGN